MSTNNRIAVVAIGGNSLIKDKQRKSIPDQYEAARETCLHVAGMVEHGWSVAIGHGNGPQVGFILRRSELSSHELHEVPLEYCGADTQGAIGYMLQQNLRNEFDRRGIEKEVATVITQVVVDSADPAFQNPSKPIGSFMDKEEAQRRVQDDLWSVVEDAGRGWRRVVASPLPIEVVERRTVETLVEAGQVVITVGGGGIPVVRDQDGKLVGTAAVIDKDFASSLLAQSIGADLFLISTAVEKVSLNFGRPDQIDVDKMTVAEARRYIKDGHFAPGSMLPKIKAALQFLDAGGQQVIITNPENIERALAGQTGTRVLP